MDVDHRLYTVYDVDGQHFVFIFLSYFRMIFLKNKLQGIPIVKNACIFQVTLGQKDTVNMA